MKYTFKPRTGIIVAGLMAAVYAGSSQCWVQATSAVCWAAGETVDRIDWGSAGGGSSAHADITATSDIVVYSSPGQYLAYSTTTANGNQNQSNTGSAVQTCAGPVTFKDYSNHSVSVQSYLAPSRRLPLVPRIVGITC